MPLCVPDHLGKVLPGGSFSLTACSLKEYCFPNCLFLCSLNLQTLKCLLPRSHFPCGLCDVSVGWDDRGICCDSCNIWYHIDCQGMTSTMYGIYNKSLSKSIAWECISCGTPNFSTSLFDTTASLEISNRFESLSSLSEPDSPIPDNIGPPPPPHAASSPIVQTKEAKPRTKRAVLNP